MFQMKFICIIITVEMNSTVVEMRSFISAPQYSSTLTLLSW